MIACSEHDEKVKAVHHHHCDPPNFKCKVALTFFVLFLTFDFRMSIDVVFEVFKPFAFSVLRVKSLDYLEEVELKDLGTSKLLYNVDSF